MHNGPLVQCLEPAGQVKAQSPRLRPRPWNAQSVRQVFTVKVLLQPGHSDDRIPDIRKRVSDPDKVRMVDVNEQIDLATGSFEYLVCILYALQGDNLQNRVAVCHTASRYILLAPFA